MNRNRIIVDEKDFVSRILYLVSRKDDEILYLVSRKNNEIFFLIFR